MSTENLLKNRWKVIADFPGNEWFEINDIITANCKDGRHRSPNGDYDEDLWIYVDPNNYPAIFKKLEWWEERDEKDLPRFLKYLSNIYPVNFYIGKTVALIGKFEFNANVVNLLLTQPSTKAEYEKQQLQRN